MRVGVAVALIVATSCDTGLVDYNDPELIRFICRYVDHSPMAWHTHDKQSIWMQLLVLLPTVYTSHVCCGGETKVMTVCSDVDAIFSTFAPTEGSAEACTHLVNTSQTLHLRKKKGGMRGLAYGMWDPKHVAETHTLRIPPPVHDYFMRRPFPVSAGAKSLIFVALRSPEESLLSTTAARNILQHLAGLQDVEVWFVPSSHTRLNASEATTLRALFDMPPSVSLLTEELAQAHNATYFDLLLRCMARASLLVTEPDLLTIAAFYFNPHHIALAALPDFISMPLLQNLGGGQLMLVDTEKDMLQAVSKLQDFSLSGVQPGGRRNLEKLLPLVPSDGRIPSNVPAVVCEQLSNYSLEPFHGEFGPELIAALPHAYFFHQCGRLQLTASCGDLSSFYFFSPRHIVHDCKRRSGGQLSYEGSFGLYSTADHVTWVPPPLRAHVQAMMRDPIGTPAGRPRIIVFNRVDCNYEDGSQTDRSPRDAFPGGEFNTSMPPHFNCKQYLGTNEISILLSRIYAWNRDAVVVYHRADSAFNMHGFSGEQGGSWESVGSNASRPAVEWVCGRLIRLPCARIDAIKDWEYLAEHWPQVITTHTVLPENMSWNDGQNAILGWGDCYVSVQGGGSYLAALFGGHNIVINMFGRAANDTHPPPQRRRRRKLVETGITYEKVLPRLSNQSLREAGSVNQLVDALDAWRSGGLCGMG